MLPSIRLIAATFFCGFLLVFAGLRIAASLNDIHASLPIMAAQAATIEAIPTADPVMRHGSLMAPIIYDLRFAPSGATLTPTLANLRPAAPPLDITPPPTGKVSKEELPAPVGSVEAKPKEEAPVAVVNPAKPATEEPGAAVKPETPASPKSDEPTAAPEESHSSVEPTPERTQAEAAETSPPIEAAQSPAPTSVTAEAVQAAAKPIETSQIAALKESAPPSPEAVLAVPASAPGRLASTDIPAAEQPSSAPPAVVSKAAPKTERERPAARPHNASTAKAATAKAAATKATAALARKKRIRVAHRAPPAAAQPASNSFGSFGSTSIASFGSAP